VAVSSGPMTMYSFGLSRPIFLNKIPQDAIACLCWGEIDCRCYINKHQPWRETINNIVKNYLEVIDVNAEIHKDIWIYNVVPPPRKALAGESLSFPFVGTDEERLSYVKYMNQKLRESGYPLVDIYDKYSDADGFLLMDLSDYHVHIENEKYLLEWVEAHR
jgi:hypothetical protein